MTAFGTVMTRILLKSSDFCHCSTAGGTNPSLQNVETRGRGTVLWVRGSSIMGKEKPRTYRTGPRYPSFAVASPSWARTLRQMRIKRLWGMVWSGFSITSSPWRKLL